MSPAELIEEVKKLPPNVDIRYLDLSSQDYKRPGGLDWKELERLGAVGIQYPDAIEIGSE